MYLQSDAYWSEFTKKRPRKMDSVVLPEEQKRAILADVDAFIANRAWYLGLGIPYRRGYLFEGPPGNGKSSIADAIAGHLERDLYVLSLAAKDLDDQKILKLMGGVPSSGVLLIEDVDAAFDKRKKKDEHASSVTFSGLLNALDGVGSRDGLIVVMSTNHVEKLDPALKRPGRVDKLVHLSNAQPAQAAELFRRFHPASPNAATFSKKVSRRTISMAALQNHLIKHPVEAEALARPIEV